MTLLNLALRLILGQRKALVNRVAVPSAPEAVGVRVREVMSQGRGHGGVRRRRVLVYPVVEAIQALAGITEYQAILLAHEGTFA